MESGFQCLFWQIYKNPSFSEIHLFLSTQKDGIEDAVF